MDRAGGVRSQCTKNRQAVPRETRGTAGLDRTAQTRDEASSALFLDQSLGMATTATTCSSMRSSPSSSSP